MKEAPSGNGSAAGFFDGVAGDEYEYLDEAAELDEFADDAMLQEAAAQSAGRSGASGAREFFWGTAVPLFLLGAVGVGAVVLFAALIVLPDDSGFAAVYAFMAGAGAALVFLPLAYYLIITRLERPIQRLEYELRGYLPWRPEGDLLLGSLRRAIEQVRTAAYSAREELEEESGRLEETHARLQELQQADRFAEQAAQAFRTSDRLEDFATVAGGLVRTVWPADDLMLLRVEEQEVRVLYHESRGRQVSPDDPEATPGYRRNALPAPIKEALQRGFYAEAGLPFSQDSAFPEARSFVAMSLEHRGGTSGVLLATSSELAPPPAEPLRRARPLFGLAYSRSVYLRQMEEAAIRDALTGAYTQNHFLSAVRHEVARSNRYSRPVTCIVLDVDRLRRVNDAHGSGRGDQVIAETAAVLEGGIRSTDLLARVSGGTFAVLLPETTASSALVVAERLRLAVEEHPYILGRGQVERLTVSLGIACHPPVGVTPLALVDAARWALGEAKRAGRNRVEVATAPDKTDADAGPDGAETPAGSGTDAGLETAALGEPGSAGDRPPLDESRG